jgi:hypothetical protein
VSRSFQRITVRVEAVHNQRRQGGSDQPIGLVWSRWTSIR